MNDTESHPPFYLGIDLGGTNVKSGVVDDQGNPLSSVSRKTHADRGADFGLQNLAEAGRDAVEASGLRWEDIKAVGLGSPGTMDLEAGMLLEPPNLPGWDNLPIRDRLGELLKKPTVLQNDANAAAYGEYWAGAARNTRSLVMFTLGTGIGCGIVSEGRIIEGRHSHGGECGHIIVQMENARRCSCGAYGHLEAYASATALVKRAQEALLDPPTASSLRNIPLAEITSQAVSEAAAAGDQLAQRLMHETARYLAVGAVCLMHTIDPDIVLFGGGMIKAGQPFLDDIRAEILNLAFPIPGKLTKIEYAELGEDAGFIGAAGCARMAFGKTS
ncbi:MAG: sugar kinase [Planctomycetes bacterium SCN 63-9]|nr:MAG: sugar kinase [Planctomycetes bacterium SCN 63-9]